MTRREIGSRGRRGLRRRVGLGALALLIVGCATQKTGEPEAIPAHPFPRWVSHLETGTTGIDEVAAVFGSPAQVEQRALGGLHWRYAYAEVHWAAEDPDRPAVAADGRPIEAEETWVDVAADGLAKTGRFLDGLLFYPPRQPRDSRSRMMNATIHELELRFTKEGVLEHYRYAPRSGRVRVPIGER